MLNTECKQCHKKWHHTNAKYCTMCGKKLVSEPEFKSGGVVASQVFSDGSFGLVRLNEDLTNCFTSVDGFWYTKRDCDIVETSFGVFKEDTRRATPEEIAEYESALNFHKHGREPFEVKRSDAVYLKGYDKNIFLDSGNIYKKHNFVDGDVVLIKAAEEIDEWLGADDDK